MKTKLLNVALLACLGVGVLAGCSGTTLTITNKEALQEEWHIGESYRTLEITTEPETNVSSAIATGDLVISSSDITVATVAGLNIYAVGEGDTTITATWGDASDSVDLSILGQVFYEMPYTVGEKYYLGIVTSEGDYKYIDGTVPEKYDYEGNLTLSLDEAVLVTLSNADDDGYYLSFELNSTTYYICIILVGSYIDLQYVTEPTPIYWNREIGAFGTEDGQYFLCYNSSYDCLYASLVTGYGPNSSKPSPIATLYDPDKAVESIPWTAPEETATYVTSITAGTYYLGLYSDYSRTTYGTYYFTGSIVNDYYGSTSADIANAVQVTVASVSSGYSLSFSPSTGTTKYIGMTATSDGHYNFTIADTAQTLIWDATYYTFTAGENSATRFLGSYGSFTTFGWYDYTRISEDHEYPARLYSISNDGNV